MTQLSTDHPATFGFLTVVELPLLGHCGGLLVVSLIGRPIEFHCTAPVQANRAQEIMYGQTYKGFIFADQIGVALMDKLKCPPTMLIVDCADLLPVSESVDCPLLLIENETLDSPFDGRGLKQFSVGSETAYCINVKSDRVEGVSRLAGQFSRTLPFEEPFERIRQAIEEAHQVLRSA